VVSNLLTIHVTAEDIANGRPGAAMTCPVALAVKRTFSNALSVCVVNNGPNVRLYPGYIRVRKSVEVSGDRYALSQEVSDFIRRVDNGLPVQPFSFVLDTNLLVDDPDLTGLL
jgi:hypothetical protein